MYQLFKPLLFQFTPEKAHSLAMKGLKLAHELPFVNNALKSYFSVKKWSKPVNFAGLTFKHPVGLAAGFDKNAEYIDCIADLGFSFIEIGTVTPKPQHGNEKPRLFRLPKDEALVNRMGFNNLGVKNAVENIRKSSRPVIIGGNIGKNKITPNEEAVTDYLICFEELFDWVDYFVVNVSSPNTPNLRALQDKEPLKALLNTLQNANAEKESPKPILLKIAPDLNLNQLADIIQIFGDTGISGIVATNTTISRKNLVTSPSAITEIGAGGLSGKPVKEYSNDVIQFLSRESNYKIPIIGVGGVFDADDVKKKLDIGASLVQLYTGFIYEGPSIVKNILKKL